MLCGVDYVIELVKWLGNCFDVCVVWLDFGDFDELFKVICVWFDIVGFEQVEIFVLLGFDENCIVVFLVVCCLIDGFGVGIQFVVV